MNGLSELPRLLAEPLREALEGAPAVVVTGSRQTGKTTLVRSLPGRSYATLDDIDVLTRARKEPDALVRTPGRVTLDEVQRAPDLLLAVKRAIDRDRTPGRFVLTGSANLLLMKQVAESLAGRAVYLTLWPMTPGEVDGMGRAGIWSSLFERPDDQWPALLRHPSPLPDWRSRARSGGYPPAALTKAQRTRDLWFAGFTQTYLERDLRDVSNVSSLVDFRRLMRATTLRIGNLVNQTELGRDVGLQQPTVRRWLDLLEVSYQLVRLEPFSRNRTSRLVKTPKAYWSDTGLAMHLAGETEPRGAHLENVVLCDLLAWRGAVPDGPSITFWRTASGLEVDFVVEWRGRLLPVEVKSTARVRVEDARSLVAFRSELGDEALPGLLLHGGNQSSWVADGVFAAPWWSVL
jgi:predicted AAA+ superfamily ATPase